MKILRSDFEKFELGPYPSEYSALPEVYCLRPRSSTHGWREPVTCNCGRGWKSDSHWMMEKRDGVNCLVQKMDFTESLNSILVKDGMPLGDCVVEAVVSAEGGRPNFVGLLFRYSDAQNYYALVLRGDRMQIVRKDVSRISVIADAEFKGGSRNLRLSVKCSADSFAASANGRRVLKCRDGMHGEGLAGIIACSGAVFHDFSVSCSDVECRRLDSVAKKRRSVIAGKRSAQPEMELWKDIKLGDFAGGRAVRYGDLSGNGMNDMLFAQAAKGAEIKCLTALDVDGNVLWQRGKPMREPWIATSDLAMQIADFNGCGRNEVVCAMDGEMLVLEGKSGKVLMRGELPDRPEPTPKSAHIGGSWFGDCLVGGGGKIVPNYIRVCNLTGRKKGLDLVCGHGYPYIWAYGADLRQMWSYTGNVGHFCYTCDVDGDGRDEVMAGYSFLRGDGTWKFSLHLQDHADAVLIMPFNHPRGKLKFVEAAGEDGLLFFDQDGWFRQTIKGHVQHFSVAKYRPDVPGLQYAVISYHGNPGLITLYDKDGLELMSTELPCVGSALHPVNWKGNGEELILFSGHREIGGLMDCHGDIVVPVPGKDGPELCCEAIRFQDDTRDKIVVYDRSRMHIYRPAGSIHKGRKTYLPEKAPLRNWSNFMAHYSYPRWG